MQANLDTVDTSKDYFTRRISILHDMLATQLGIAANIFFPLCFQNHFTLLVFDTQKTGFVHYNSRRGPANAVPAENIHYKMATKVVCIVYSLPNNSPVQPFYYWVYYLITKMHYHADGLCGGVDARRMFGKN